MTGEVEVERARVEDWERARALRLAALADAPDAFGSTLADERDRPPSWWRGRLAGPAATLLARLDERDVGLTVVAPAWDDPAVAGLYAMWVAPAARGRGAGDALVAAALRAAAEMGFARIVLEVADANVAAQRLYRRCGFTPTGRRSAMAPPREHITEHELARAT